MGFLQKLLNYINPASLRTQNGEEKKNVSLRFMHGINRISIWMMLFAVIVMIIRYFIR